MFIQRLYHELEFNKQGIYIEVEFDKQRLFKLEFNKPSSNLQRMYISVGVIYLGI